MKEPGYNILSRRTEILTLYKNNMKRLNDVFALFMKLGPFCKKYTNIDPAKGLYHRMKGYSTGGKEGKSADLTDDDRTQIKEGLRKFVNDVNELIAKN